MVPGSSASLYPPPVSLMTAEVLRANRAWPVAWSALPRPGASQLTRSHRRHQMRLLYFRKLRADHSPEPNAIAAPITQIRAQHRQLHQPVTVVHNGGSVGVLRDVRCHSA